MKDKILELHNQGFGTVEIAKQTGVTAATISYHKRKLNLPLNKQMHRDDRDWSSIQKDIDENILNHFEIVKKHNICRDTLTRAYKRGKVKRDKLPNELTTKEYADSWIGKEAKTGFKRILIKRLVKEGIWKMECKECQLTEWRGKPAPLEVNHIDGNPKNNSIDNLELLCRNCHYFTPTWGNKKRV